MDILPCKICRNMPVEGVGPVHFVTLKCVKCNACITPCSTAAYAIQKWNEKYGAKPSEPPAKPRCLKCGQFMPVKDGDYCAGCMRKAGQGDDYRKAKHDAGKLPLNLIPPSTYEALGRVMQYGAGLYGENTWQRLPDGTKRCHAALLRHLVAWHGGEKVDPGSGLPHLEHVLWNAAVLVEYEK